MISKRARKDKVPAKPKSQSVVPRNRKTVNKKQREKGQESGREGGAAHVSLRQLTSCIGN
jgi:hypothetical protein